MEKVPLIFQQDNANILKYVMAITLTIIESTNQIIAGIPESITISSSIPAVFFYTLDGEDPTVDSLTIDGSILFLPTTKTNFTLKVVAISGLESSAIFEDTYTASFGPSPKRLEETDGINLLPPGKDVVGNLSYDAEGSPSQETSIDFQDLELKASQRDKFQQYPEGKTSIGFINFPLELFESKEPYQGSSSTPNNNLNFDPQAGLIIIDGSTNEAMAAQEVKIINRPHGTMTPKNDVYNESYSLTPLVTGNLVRYYYNPNTGKIVFYYYDSRDTRWIQSIQKIEPKTLNISAFYDGSRVFRWIQDPVMSKII